MDAFTRLTGPVLVLPQENIDTDQIIPGRFLTATSFEGMGDHAFADWRFDGDGNPDPDCVLNEPRAAASPILVAGRNFGCGSSREHAPQALMRSGIHAVIGESFAEIFAGNCTAMGVPAVKLSHEEVEEIMNGVESDPATEISIDLPKGILTVGGKVYSFDIPPAYLNALTAGTWDSTSVLLSSLPEIDQTMQSVPYLKHFAS